MTEKEIATLIAEALRQDCSIHGMRGPSGQFRHTDDRNKLRNQIATRILEIRGTLVKFHPNEPIEA